MDGRNGKNQEKPALIVVIDRFLPANGNYKKPSQHLPYHLWLLSHLSRPFQPKITDIITDKKETPTQNDLACDPNGIIRNS